MRLHELAKELGAESKVLLGIAKELNLGVKSHSSTIPKGAEGILRAAWAEELAEMEEEAAKKAAAEKKEEPAPAPAPEPAPEPEAVEKPADGGGGPAFTITVKTGKAPEPQAEPEPESAPVEEAAEEQPEPAVEAEPEPVAEAAEEPAAAEGTEEEPHKMVVTIGGQVALPGEKPEDEEAADEEGEDTTSTDDAPEAATEEKKAKKPRRGARILGRIDLPAQPARRPRSQPSEYDPLDPTRPAQPKRPAARGRSPGDQQKKGKGAGGGKPTQPEWVFDPEDSSTLSAVRLGHFGTGRRPPVRRPPPVRRSMPGQRKRKGPVVRPTHAVTVQAPMGVRELSEVLGLKTREILQRFPDDFDPRDKNAVLDHEHLELLVVELDRDITVLPPISAEERLLDAEAQRAEEMAGEPQPRPPVVAVMGHVDHGKTTLLDALRKTSVAAKEAGGITQRTSAYQVTTPSGAQVTFLDTPGHKAFTEMRARGAQITDVAVLVVAADDGVMAQTQEAIDHANAAGVPMVVAVNKCDLPGANPQMVRQQLASAGVLVEDYGGEIGIVECSATTGAGLDELVERLALETEILELRANPEVPATGVVVDTRKDKDMGIVCTVIVNDGTLRPKDQLLAGHCVARVRYLLDDTGKRIKEAGPSKPVQVFGFEEPPESGVVFLAVEDMNEARTVARERLEASKAEQAAEAPVDAVTLENLFDHIEAQAVQEVNLLIKADAQGTLDVLRRTVDEMAHPEVRFKIIRAGIGGITEDDVLLAEASQAIIVGFSVVPDTKARREIERAGIDCKLYEIIYELTEDLEKALEGQLAPDTQENIKGHAEIRAVFKSSKFGNIAGCYVTDGVITRDSRARLVRDGQVVWDGRLDSLRRFQDDTKEVKENYECGIHLSNFNDIKEGDVIEAYEVIEVKRTLDQAASKN